jgi:hypothetical protein
MVRLVLGIVCGAALVLASVIASAQNRPAAWDTRVRSPAPATADPQDDKNAQQPKEKTKKPPGAAVEPKHRKSKLD